MHIKTEAFKALVEGNKSFLLSLKTKSFSEHMSDVALAAVIEELLAQLKDTIPPVCVVTSTCTAKGIWFRNPFFQRYIDVYDDGESSNYSASSALKPKSLIAAVHWLINRRKVLKRHVAFVSDNCDAAGYSLLSVRSPFYFVREERKLTAEGYGLKVISYGHNYVDERVAGCCEQEHTVVLKTTVDGPEVLWAGTSRVNRSYKFTYESIAEGLLTHYSKTGAIDVSLNSYV